MSVTSTSSTNSLRVLRMNKGVSSSTSSNSQMLSVFADAFGLQGPETYTYTSMSNCLEVQDIDDVKDYAQTIVSPGFQSLRPRS